MTLKATAFAPSRPRRWHSGVCLIEPELFRGYDSKVFNQEIELLHDLEPFEVAEVRIQFVKFKKILRVGVRPLCGGSQYVRYYGSFMGGIESLPQIDIYLINLTRFCFLRVVPSKFLCACATVLQ
ncbi:hypothetical protein A0H81_05120 [Grifola frondosa]|uniref:Uncharacterized protein n=1 Tax=Grifola frondosa TaxID=5627 RepID=A0A1C7MD81_GRIFR|nr:hypothetical protein A0H81_05120 [Grifola frondosa]